MGNSPTFYTVPLGLLEDSSVIYGSVQQEGMGMPPGLCYASTATRDVLALQQCTWCHTTESNTAFHHIKNRYPKGSSVPSGFLAGLHPSDGTTLHPRLSDLYYANPQVVWSTDPDFHYDTYPGAPCNTRVRASVTHRFHDIARQTLFLANISVGGISPLLLLDSVPEPFSTSFPE